MRLRAVIFLIIFYFTYLLVGALIFYALEFASEEQRCLEAIAEIRRYNLSATEENITVEDFRSLVQTLLRARSSGVQFNSQLEPSCALNWNFPNSFFFAGTVVTTIGYGNISPSTSGGRVFCIFFAAIGLPFFGLMFSELGERFAGVFTKLEKKLEPKIKRVKICKAIVLLLLVGSLLVFGLLIPSIIFMVVENWTYQESFYYSFITLTTIGFGDFVVGTNPDRSYDGSYGIYRVSVYFWILFGLAFMAAVINRFSDIIKSKAKPDKNETEKDPGIESDSIHQGKDCIDGKTNNTTQEYENTGSIKDSTDDSIERHNVPESADLVFLSKDANADANHPHELSSD